MKKKLGIGLLILLGVSCIDKAPQSDKWKNEKEAIQAIMNEQQAAWNMADIPAFMKYYWKSDSLKFIGKSGLTYGWQPTLDNYLRSYPSQAAMGKLQFTNIYIEPLTDASAYVIGKWELFRISDTLSGHYTLLWKKLNGQWLIVADHSS